MKILKILGIKPTLMVVRIFDLREDPQNYRENWNRSWVNRKVLEVFFVLDQSKNIFPSFEDINSLIKLPNTLARNPINCPARPAYRPAMGLICQIWSFDFEAPDEETVSEASQEDVHERYHVTHWRRHFLELVPIAENWLMINIMREIHNRVLSSQGRKHVIIETVSFQIRTCGPEISYLNMNDRERLKPTYLQNDGEFLEVLVFEKSKASECFYDESNLDLYNLCSILYRGLTGVNSENFAS